MCLGLWRLLGMAGRRFGRALDGLWPEYLQKNQEHTRVFKVTEVRL